MTESPDRAVLACDGRDLCCPEAFASQPESPLASSGSGRSCDSFRVVAGIDEVGRGPLAGPVVAAAVVLDMKRVPDGLADSKVLSPEQRDALFENPRQRRGRRRLGSAWRDRRRQHPAGVARPCAGRSPPCPARPTSPSSTATIRQSSLPGRDDRQGRRPNRLHRRRVDRRQGRARPHDETPCRGVSSLRVRPQRRLRHGGASRGADGARSLPLPPRELRAGAGRRTVTARPAPSRESQAVQRPGQKVRAPIRDALFSILKRGSLP